MKKPGPILDKQHQRCDHRRKVYQIRHTRLVGDRQDHQQDEQSGGQVICGMNAPSQQGDEDNQRARASERQARNDSLRRTALRQSRMSARGS